MGNDGGSIPKRHELVKSAARTPTLSELKATAHESLTHAWTHCAITAEPLDMQNCVSDWRGKLYNYESVLKTLMPSDDADATEAKEGDGAAGEGEGGAGIKSLKDIVKLKFKKDEGKKVWACPVSWKELGAGTKAVYIVPCGHVFAEVAIKEISERACPECSEAFEERDVIPVLPTTEKEILKLARRIEELQAQGLSHSLKKDKKKDKKRKRRADTNEEGEKKQKKEKKKDTRLDGINNSATANLMAKVLAEQDELAKRRKLAAGRA